MTSINLATLRALFYHTRRGRLRHFRKYEERRGGYTFAHGLWSYAILRKSKAPVLVIVTAILPDLIPFTPHFIHQLCIKGIKLKFVSPPLESIPDYVFTAYNLTHSLVIVALIFGLVFILTRKIPLFLWAWPIHIAMDIPTHTKAFSQQNFCTLFPNSI